MICQSSCGLPSCFQIPSLLIFPPPFIYALYTVLWGLCSPPLCSLSVSSCPVSSLPSPVLYYFASSFLPCYWVTKLTSLQFHVLNSLQHCAYSSTHSLPLGRKFALELARWGNKGNRTGGVCAGSVNSTKLIEHSHNTEWNKLNAWRLVVVSCKNVFI